MHIHNNNKNNKIIYSIKIWNRKSGPKADYAPHKHKIHNIGKIVKQ